MAKNKRFRAVRGDPTALPERGLSPGWQQAAREPFAAASASLRRMLIDDEEVRAAVARAAKSTGRPAFDIVANLLLATDAERRGVAEHLKDLERWRAVERAVRELGPEGVGSNLYGEARRHLRLAGDDITRLDRLIQDPRSQCRGTHTDVVKANFLRRLAALPFKTERDRVACGAILYSRLFLPAGNVLDDDAFAKQLRKRRRQDAEDRKRVYRGRRHNIVISETEVRLKG